MAEKKILLSKKLALPDVYWPPILNRLQTQFRFSPEASEAVVEKFRARLFSSVSFSLFPGAILTEEEGVLLKAIAEVNGCDELILEVDRRSQLVLLPFHFHQSVTFHPFQSSAVMRRKAGVKFLGLSWPVTTFFETCVFYVAIGTLASLFVAFFLFVFLYGMAVILLFVQLPSAVTHAASRDVRIWLGALAFLTIFAGLFGRATVNISRSVFEWLKRR